MVTTTTAPARPLGKRLEKWTIDKFIRLLASVTRLLPRRAQAHFGSLLGMLYYRLVRVHRRRASYNLGKVFPTLPPAELSRLVRQIFVSFGRSAVEFLRLTTLSPAEVAGTVRLEGEEHLQAALARGKGALLITAHYGNWEMMGARLTGAGYPLDAIARTLDTPASNEIVNAIRRSHGMRVFERGSVLGAARALKENRILAILLDQHDYDGVTVDFLGYPARTAMGPAALALKTGAALVPAFCLRQPDGSFVVQIAPYLTAESTGDKEADVRRVTQQLVDIIAAQIRVCPEQWLWFHLRWRTTPGFYPETLL